jgi:DNA-binding response OmpR family regulator
MHTDRKSMKTILIADEDSTIRRSISAVFSNIGYRVISVSGGADALSKSKEMKPDIVIADVFLSDGDGYTVSGKIKDDPALEDTPVILHASSLAAFDEVQAAEGRADDFIIKPLTSEIVIKKVESLINQHEEREMSAAFNFLSHAEESIAGSSQFDSLNEATTPGEGPEFGRGEYNSDAEDIKTGKGTTESDEEIILLEEEIIEHPSNSKPNGKMIDTVDEKSQTEIVYKVSEIVMKRLSEVIPESISKVIDSVLKEEIKGVK